MANVFNIRSNLMMGGLAIVLTGCASEPVPAPAPPAPVLSGDQMLSESQTLANLAEKSKRGKQLIEKGGVLVREGQSKIDEGRRLIEEGQQMKDESEESYKNIKK
jgi:hypothetical protein